MSGFSIIIKILGGIIAAILIVILIATYLSYQSDISAARERVITGSQIIGTKCGQIEYTTMGEGQPVLVVHGAGGGYDQGILLAQDWANDGFRVIAPSRFGYLCTPLPENATPAAQADAHACLLDALNISRVAIVGISAGGPSTLQFALRYPDRTSSMVLYSALVHKEMPMDFRGKIINDVILKSDFLFWLITKYFEPDMVLLFGGLTPEVYANLTPEEKYWLSDVFMPSMYPISQRQPGLLNDINNFPYLDYPLNQTTVPTLVIYAKDDQLLNTSHSQYAARNIPNANVTALESGGHLLMGQRERVRSEITKFLKQYAIAG